MHVSIKVLRAEVSLALALTTFRAFISAHLLIMLGQYLKYFIYLPQALYNNHGKI